MGVERAAWGLDAMGVEAPMLQMELGRVDVRGWEHQEQCIRS